MAWFVYIVQAATGRYYTGITTNPNERLTEHNLGIGSNFARNQGFLNIVFCSPPFSSKSDVRKREVQIKRWSRWKKEKLIRGEWN